MGLISFILFFLVPYLSFTSFPFSDKVSTFSCCVHLLLVLHLSVSSFLIYIFCLHFFFICNDFTFSFLLTFWNSPPIYYAENFPSLYCYHWILGHCFHLLLSIIIHLLVNFSNFLCICILFYFLTSLSALTIHLTLTRVYQIFKI